ncbi:MAG: hypothetical protein ABI359_13495, partial [Ginsengibacter sp.]
RPLTTNGKQNVYQKPDYWMNFNSLRTEVSLLRFFCLPKATDFLLLFLNKHNDVVRDYCG